VPVGILAITLILTCGPYLIILAAEPFLRFGRSA
jgi:hypothetical protein